MVYISIILLILGGILDIVSGFIDLINKERKSGMYAILIGIIFLITAVDNYHRNFKDNTPPSTTINNYYYTEEN